MQVSIVGYSSIVSRKIIPALIRFRDIEKINIFSRRSKLLSEQVNADTKLNFLDINELLNFIKSNNSIFYYISTENYNHFYFSNLLLNEKQNIIVDKPIALNSNDLNILIKSAERNKCFIGESLTWQYHKQLNYLKDFLERNKKARVKTSFTIPLPQEGSFRVNNKNGSGVFWDMSTYLFSTLEILNISEVSISYSKNIGSFNPQWIVARSKSEEINFEGIYGFGFNYQNSLELISDNEIIRFERIYTSDPKVPVSIYQINTNKSNHIEELDDAFYNYFAHIKSLIIKKDFVSESVKLYNLYKKILKTL